jgi:hypothetical protein
MIFLQSFFPIEDCFCPRLISQNKIAWNGLYRKFMAHLEKQANNPGNLQRQTIFSKNFIYLKDFWNGQRTCKKNARILKGEVIWIESVV